MVVVVSVGVIVVSVGVIVVSVCVVVVTVVVSCVLIVEEPPELLPQEARADSERAISTAAIRFNVIQSPLLMITNMYRYTFS